MKNKSSISLKTLLISSLIIIFATSFTASAQMIISRFTDATEFADWYKAAVLSLEEQGVLQGNPDGSFQPGDYVNRAQLAVILDRYQKNIVNTYGNYNIDTGCTDSVEPGLYLYLRNATTGESLDSAEVTANNIEMFAGDLDEEPVELFGRYAGYYTLDIASPGYQNHIETVKMEMGQCHLIPQTRTIYLYPELAQ